MGVALVLLVGPASLSKLLLALGLIFGGHRNSRLVFLVTTGLERRCADCTTGLVLGLSVGSGAASGSCDCVTVAGYSFSVAQVAQAASPFPKSHQELTGASGAPDGRSALPSLSGWLRCRSGSSSEVSLSDPVAAFLSSLVESR
jgi:hypothetical protein